MPVMPDPDTYTPPAPVKPPAVKATTPTRRAAPGKKAATTTAAPSTTSPTIDAGTMAVDYGFALAVFNSNPELKTLFNNAVKGGWTADKFTAELRGTTWFKTTSDTARSWAIEAAADPKTAQQREATRQQTLSDEAGQLGVTLSPAQLAKMTTNSIMYGWTDAQVRQVMGAAWKYNPTTPTAGLAASTISTMRQQAASYAVPISDGAIQKWTAGVLEGTGTPDDYLSYVKDQAKSLYGPGVAAAIDNGQTVDQYADPYRQLLVQNTGVNPDDVNWTDPKYNRFLNNVDPTTGKQAGPLSLSDAVKVMRTDPQYGYDTSEAGRQSSAQLTTQLAQRLGAM